jgi:hypothetical protein
LADQEDDEPGLVKFALPDELVTTATWELPSEKLALFDECEFEEPPPQPARKKLIDRNINLHKYRVVMAEGENPITGPRNEYGESYCINRFQVCFALISPT